MVMDMDDREKTVHERAEEILARQPTPDEIAEHEARVQSNRIAEIMKPKPEIIHRVQENAAAKNGHTSRPATRRYVDRQFDTLLDVFARKFAEIQHQISASEAAVKPRHRVKARTRTI